MRINVVTIFPAFFDEPLRTSIPGRAATAGIAEYRVVDLRDYTHDRHRTVDDEPYGGGAGMVMKPEPLAKALGAARERMPDALTLLMTPQGRPFSQQTAAELARRYAHSSRAI